jgi:hypothetical protein
VIVARLFDLSAQEDHRLLADAWEPLVTLVTPALDLPSRTELRRLGAALADSAAPRPA